MLSFSLGVQAHDNNHIEFNRSQIVYVTSEDDFLTYPKDVHTQYTFIFLPSTKATTMCPTCRKPATYYNSREQISAYTWACQYDNSLCPDVVSSYNNYQNIDCTCGYWGKRFLYKSYTVYCGNDGITYPASYSTTIYQGYNIHCDMNFWS